MSYEKSETWEKFNALNRAVMDGLPSEAADAVKKLDEIRFTAQALGLACRYRGLDMVKALVEGGAKFDYDMAQAGWNAESELRNFAAALLSQIYLSEMSVIYNIGKNYDRPMLPIKDRLEILEYLRKTAGKTGFDEGELLFYSYFSGDKEITDYLKENGAAISEEWVRIITEGGGKNEKTKEKWFDYCTLTERLSNEDYLPCMTAVVTEIGGRKLYFTDWLWHISTKRLELPGFMKFLLLNYDHSKIKKGMMMKEIILRDDAESLELAADNGWLKMPKKRDEMIAFAADNQKTECTAWLLDFKNRTADLAAERAKAEKKQERELNAAPDSVTILKQLWKYKKREDGTLAITGYKGTQTEMTVPEKIGKSIVTAIKPDTYPSGTPKNYFASHEIQISITKITLPQSLVTIGDGSFCEFEWLREINIPDGVTSIGKMAFFGCTLLRQLRLPDSVTEIDSYAFQECTNLEEINIPRGVTKICELAFAWCESLKAIEIPETVKSIEKNAFGGCKSLEAVIIPNGVTVINRGAFGSCEKLMRVELPDTIVKIGTYAFFGCKSLKKFVIPEGVLVIGESAFGDCSVLKELVIPEGVLEIGEMAFSDCTALEKVVLPASLKRAKNRTLRGEIKISRTIFDNSPNVTAVVTPKSYAERYCKRNNIPFVYKNN